MRAKRKIISVCSCLAIVLGLLALAPRPCPAEKTSFGPETQRIENAINVLNELVGLPAEGIPARIFQKSSGIAVIPGVIKAAYGLGGQYGKGIIVLRNEKNEWSNPVFISLYGGSIGWQIGVQKADFILVFKTVQTIRNIAQGKITMGADVSVSAGPVGKTAEANTDLELKAEILSYSKSRGLFAGVSVKGATIQIDKEANRIFYEKGEISVDEIFSGENVKAPAIVEKLKTVLAEYSKSI